MSEQSNIGGMLPKFAAILFLVCLSGQVNGAPGGPPTKSPSATPTLAPSANIDYSCLHSTSWLVNTNGQYSSKYSSTSDITTSAFVNATTATTGWKVSFTGIPFYGHTMTSSEITELNSRPKASSDFDNGATSATAGTYYAFGDDIGYSSSSCGDGYWPNGPSCPAAYSGLYTFPVFPSPETGDCYVPLHLGYFVNGVPLWSWSDATTYNSDEVWYNLAMSFEQYDMDICMGHSANGVYHHHSVSPCLRTQLNDTGDSHSTVFGFAYDGYPIYGPYQAANTLAVSCWQARDYDDATVGCSGGKRTCVFVNEFNYTEGTTNATSSGPDPSGTTSTQSGNTISAASGIYYQDYFLNTTCVELGGEHLDGFNGHTHGDYEYHYHVTMDSSETPTFPYGVGPKYYGCLPNSGSCQTGIDSDSGTTTSSCTTNPTQKAGSCTAYESSPAISYPTFAPTISSAPTANFPTKAPSGSPSHPPKPNSSPTASPSRAPSKSPSLSPSLSPTVIPSISPTVVPSISPSVVPTVSPTTLAPTLVPTTTKPTVEPTISPTENPTISLSPTVEPTISPTESPTISLNPTVTPTVTPSVSPSVNPTVTPTVQPTIQPTVSPTVIPTVNPTVSPSEQPSEVPSVEPTVMPSISPTLAPTTKAPSVSPTRRPTITPSQAPSYQTVPILSFSTSTTMSGLTSSTLDDAAEDAIVNATASSLGISTTYVTFSGSTTESRRLLKSRLLDATYTITATTDVVIPLINIVTDDDYNVTAIYYSLKTSFDSAVTSGDFASYLTIASIALGSTSTQNVTVTSHSVDNLAVADSPTFQPTEKPNSSDDSSSGLLLHGTNLYLTIGLCGGGGLFIIALIVYCCACRKQSSSASPHGDIEQAVVVPRNTPSTPSRASRSATPASGAAAGVGASASATPKSTTSKGKKPKGTKGAVKKQKSKKPTGFEMTVHDNPSYELGI